MRDFTTNFLDGDEKEVFVLGEKDFNSYLKGITKKLCFIVLSNKSIYIYGRKYYNDEIFSNNRDELSIIGLQQIQNISIVYRRSRIILLILLCIISISLCFMPSFFYNILNNSYLLPHENTVGIILNLIITILLPLIILAIYIKNKKRNLKISYQDKSLIILAEGFTEKELSFFIEYIKEARTKLNRESNPAPKNDFNEISNKLKGYQKLLDNGIISANDYNRLKENIIK